MIILETERLILRDLEEKDIAKRIEWETVDREWQKWDAPWEYEGLSEEEEKTILEDYVERLRRTAQILASKSKVEIRKAFQIEVKETGEYIGWIGCYFIDDHYCYSETAGKTALGIDLPSVNSRGKGCGYEAFHAVIQYLADHGYREFYTQTWSGNVCMIALAEKLGFEEVCRKKDLRTVNGKKYDGLTFRYTGK